MSDDAVRDAGDDTVLYIIPGDSAAPYSRLWIEESNYGRSVTPQCYYQVDMSTAGLGEGWAATHMAAIKAVSMRDADAEIYRYIYIKKKKTEFIERARCLLCALTDTWTSRLMLLSPPVRT